MVKQVIWQKRPLEQQHDLLVYLETEFSFQTAQKFSARMDQMLELLKKQPLIGRPVKNRSNIRYVKVGRYQRMYYRLHGNTMYIIRLFDMRQDPKKDPFQ